MIDITHVFANSKLKRATEVFKFYSTEAGETDFGYTPFSITTWNQGKYDHEDPRNISYAFHDLSHMLLNFHRGSDGYNGYKETILKENFGYKKENNLMSSVHGFNETAVLGLQSVLEMDNPEIVQQYDSDEVFEIIQKHHNYRSKKADFERHRWHWMQRFNTDQIYRLLDKSCTFILENRDNATPNHS